MTQSIEGRTEALKRATPVNAGHLNEALRIIDEQKSEINRQGGVITEWERAMDVTLGTLMRVSEEKQKLLEALRTILEDADNISYHTPLPKDFWDEARAAIAEATGRAA